MPPSGRPQRIGSQDAPSPHADWRPNAVTMTVPMSSLLVLTLQYPVATPGMSTRNRAGAVTVLGDCAYRHQTSHHSTAHHSAAHHSAAANRHDNLPGLSDNAVAIEQCQK